MAANANSGFSLTENNYAAAISLLKDIFGRHDNSVCAYPNNLLNNASLQSSSGTRGLRNLYKCLVQIQNLVSQGLN